MNTKSAVEKTGEIKRNVKVEIPGEVYTDQFSEAVSRVAASAKLKGFRPGHASKAVVEKIYGKTIHEDLMSRLINDALQDAFAEHSLRVVGFPKLEIGDFEKGKDLKFSAEIDVFPEPEIRDYFGLKFEAEVEDTEVSEEELFGLIEQVKEQHVTLEDVTDRATVEQGDILTIDYVGTIDGETLEGSSVEDAVVTLGNESLPAEFEQGLLGSVVGEEKEIAIKFPEEAKNKKLAGKEAVYRATVKTICKKVFPELNDELAKKTGFAEDVNGLKDYLKKTRMEHAEEANERAIQSKFFEVLAEKNAFEVPQALVDEEIRELLFELGGLDRSKKESYQVDVSQYRESFNNGAEFRVRRYIMLEQIIKQEGLEVQDEDMDLWLIARSEKSGQPRDDLEKAFGLPGNKEAVKKMVAREKMVKQLIEKAVVKKVKKSKDTEKEEKSSEN